MWETIMRFDFIHVPAEIEDARWISQDSGSVRNEPII